ncbi:MAG: DUF3194 domain-containing protein [Candidatus Hodarchaeota archaeon]
MDIELDEVIDQLYTRIHQFLQSKVGEDLDQDIVDINLELTAEKEIIVNIEIYLELSPFSKFNVEKIANEAIKHGISAADQIFPSFLVNIKQK